jgi:hypothetical protein
MQPGLLLASRIIEMKHPFWMAVLDICNLHPVDPSRDPEADPHNPKPRPFQLVQIFDNLEENPPVEVSEHSSRLVFVKSFLLDARKRLYCRKGGD